MNTNAPKKFDNLKEVDKFLEHIFTKIESWRDRRPTKTNNKVIN
jgi:hypothetical protein